MKLGKQESQELMDSVLPFAEKMLSEHGEFFPYGGAMKPNGEIVSIGGDNGEEHPPSNELISLLKNAFKDSATSKVYKATALVYDVRVPLPGTGEKTDAIAINLDHVSGYSVIVFLPYSLKNDELKLGQIFAQAGSNDVFN
jgi:hypothetical protein